MGYPPEIWSPYTPDIALSHDVIWNDRMKTWGDMISLVWQFGNAVRPLFTDQVTNCFIPTVLKQMHSRDTTILMVLLWFSIVHYSSLFQYFFIDLLLSLTLVENSSCFRVPQLNWRVKYPLQFFVCYSMFTPLYNSMNHELFEVRL